MSVPPVPQPASRPCVLVTGFGPFLSVVDNPSARLALAVNDPDGVPAIVGRVIPVSYDAGPGQAITLARRLGSRLVLGLGVAVGRGDVCVEAVARRQLSPGRPDVDGMRRCWVSDDSDAPALVAASVAVDTLAHALQARLSNDAGSYVCNAWLYRVARALGPEVDVGFIHVPASGMAVDRLRQGIAAVVSTWALSPPLALGVGPPADRSV